MNYSLQFLSIIFLSSHCFAMEITHMVPANQKLLSQEIVYTSYSGIGSIQVPDYPAYQPLDKKTKKFSDEELQQSLGYNMAKLPVEVAKQIFACKLAIDNGLESKALMQEKLNTINLSSAGMIYSFFRMQRDRLLLNEMILEFNNLTSDDIRDLDDSDAELLFDLFSSIEAKPGLLWGQRSSFRRITDKRNYDSLRGKPILLLGKEYKLLADISAKQGWHIEHSGEWETAVSLGSIGVFVPSAGFSGAGLLACCSEGTATPVSIWMGMGGAVGMFLAPLVCLASYPPCCDDVVGVTKIEKNKSL